MAGNAKTDADNDDDEEQSRDDSHDLGAQMTMVMSEKVLTSRRE